jgi:hypothetical protein
MKALESSDEPELVDDVLIADWVGMYPFKIDMSQVEFIGIGPVEEKQPKKSTKDKEESNEEPKGIFKLGASGRGY